MIQISSSDERPIFKQIVDGLSMQILTGEVVPGTRLPSIRGLAMQLTINTNTVAKAYAELTNLGFVESRPGLGLYVCKPRPLFSDTEREKRFAAALDRFITDALSLNYTHEEILVRIGEALSDISDKKSA